jgi:hypothetical protein
MIEQPPALNGFTGPLKTKRKSNDKILLQNKRNK